MKITCMEPLKNVFHEKQMGVDRGEQAVRQ